MKLILYRKKYIVKNGKPDFYLHSVILTL